MNKEFIFQRGDSFQIDCECNWFHDYKGIMIDNFPKGTLFTFLESSEKGVKWQFGRVTPSWVTSWPILLHGKFFYFGVHSYTVDRVFYERDFLWMRKFV